VRPPVCFEMIFRFLAIPALALLLPVIAAFANDPSALFLKAYQDYQCGENFERDGRLRDAMNSYASTVAILEQVRKDDPSWQEMVVNFRMRKAQQNIERLRLVVAAEPEKLPNHEDPLPTRGFEIDIPEPLVTTRPRQTNEAAPKTPASTSNSDREQIESLERQVAEFKKSLSTEKKLREKMEGELASSKMELEKTKIELVSINSRAVQAEDAFKNLTQERDELRKKAGDPPDKKIEILSGRIAALEAENEVANENNTRLVEKLKRAADYISGIKNVLAATDEDRRNLATERNNALGRIKSLKDNFAELKALRGQNASLQKELALKKSDLDRLAKIESENKNLAQKLDASEKKLADVSSSGGLSKEEAGRLHEDLALLQERLAVSREELASRDASVKSLASQLEKATGDLAISKLNSGPSEEQQRLYSESQLLRQIVIRQITEQSQRAQAVSDLENELQRLQVQSEALAASLGILSNPPPIVKDEERALFREPIVVLQDPQTDGVPLSLTAVKSAKASQNKLSGGASELSDDARQLATQASELVKQRRFTDAEKKYQRVVDIDPSNHFAFANLAVIQIELGKLPAAKAALEKSLSLKNDDVFASVNLANVHCRQGRFDDAINLLKRVIPLEPQNAVAYNYLAIALGKRGDIAQAEESFRESLAINPNYANAHFNLAVMYANAQSPSLVLAKSHYEKAKALGAEPDPILERRLAQIPQSN
jgi:Flp pilus assembly protein TadD